MIYLWLVIIAMIPYAITDGIKFFGNLSAGLGWQKIKLLGWLRYCLVAGITAILLGSRYFLGHDYAQYYNVIIPEIINNIGKHEVLFSLLTKLVYPLGGAFYVIFWVTVINVIFLYKAIDERSPYFVLSVIIAIGTLFIPFSLSGIRQGAVMAIFLYAVKYIKQGKWKPYVFWIVVAMGFHMSAALYLPAYFIRRLKFKPSLIWILPITFALAPLILKIISVLGGVLNFYSSYFSDARYLGAADRIYDVILVLLELVIICMYYVVKKEKNLKTDEQNELSIGMAFQVVILFLLGLVAVLPTATRTILLFESINIIFIPKLLSWVSDIRKRLLFIMVLLTLLGVVFTNYILKYNYYETLPFVVQWNGTIYKPALLN